MNAVGATEGMFFSALQPTTSVTTYAVPSDDQLARDRLSKVKRVQQQVQQRMAEKAASSSRQSASHVTSTGEQSPTAVCYGSSNTQYTDDPLCVFRKTD